MVKTGIHPLNDALDGLFKVGKEGLRVDANPEGQGDEREKDCVLAEVEVGERFVYVMSDGAEHGALVEPEEIRGAKHDAQRGPGGPGFADHESALQDGEFADETVEQRHAERAEGDDEVDGGEVGHGRGEAAELRDEARVAALVEDTDDEEERAG